MSGGIADVEQAILDAALDILEDGARPAPELATVYHSEPPVRCCESLFVFWPRAAPDRAGIPAGMAAPPGRQQVDLSLRLYRCWPKIGADGSPPAGTGDAALGLAIDGDCLWAGFTARICAHEFMAVTSGVDGLLLLDMTPRPNLVCAGVQLRFTATPKPWVADFGS